MAQVSEQLAVVRGPDKGKVWTLKANKSYTLGRSSDNVVYLSDPTVSHNHAVVQYEDGIWFIVDVGSKHGTWVNDVRVEGRKPLFHKDIVRAGKSYLVYWKGKTGKVRAKKGNG